MSMPFCKALTPFAEEMITGRIAVDCAAAGKPEPGSSSGSDFPNKRLVEASALPVNVVKKNLRRDQRSMRTLLQRNQNEPSCTVSEKARKRNSSANSRAALIRATERQEVLRAFDRFLQATKELLQIFAALDEIDFGGVDDQQVGAGIAEEKVFVGAGDFFDVFG